MKCNYILIKRIEGKLEDLDGNFNGSEFNWGTIKVRDSGRIKGDVLLTFEYLPDVASYLNHTKFIQVINELLKETTGKSEVFSCSYTVKTSVTLLVGCLSK